MELSQPVDVVDAVIVGGGPAGLSAAISLGRACRSVAVFDCRRPGRSDWSQVNHNYLGFPDGISAVELGAHGRTQAERFGARFYEAEVAQLVHEDELFRATAPDRTVHARAVVLATGVSDRWVQFPGYEDFIGRTLHWCIVCDGYEMRDQRVLVVGNDEQIADLAVQMLTYAKQVTLVTNSGSLGLPPAALQELDEHGIRVVVGRITGATAKAKGAFKAVRVEGGDDIELDHMFSHQGSDPNNALARALGLELNAEGFIQIDTEGRTSQAGVYAAGDVTCLFGHQVAAAVHEGATAANALNSDLFQCDKRAFAAGRRKMEDRSCGRAVVGSRWFVGAVREPPCSGTTYCATDNVLSCRLPTTDYRTTARPQDRLRPFVGQAVFRPLCHGKCPRWPLRSHAVCRQTPNSGKLIVIAGGAVTPRDSTPMNPP